MWYGVTRPFLGSCVTSRERKLTLSSLHVILLALVAGCRSSTPNSIADWEQSRESSSARVSSSICGDAGTFELCTLSFQPESPAADDPQDPIRISIRDAARIALATSPELVAIRQNEPISIAALEVARTYPFNPQASVDVRPFTRERNGDNAGTLVSTSIQQEFELAHQGRYRAQAGEAELDRTRWTILQAELATTVMAEQRFFAALYQRQRLELATSLADMNQQLLGVLQRRFEAGQATATDVSLARIQIAATQQQVELARVMYETALNELRTGLGLPPAAVLDLVGNLERYEWRPLSASPHRSDEAAVSATPINWTDRQVTTRWLSSRPDIRAAEADVNAARARLELACASRTPNVKIGPVYEHDEAGTQFFGMEASMPLPILNTGGPLVRQRYAEMQQRIVAREQLAQKAKLEIQAALNRYTRARQAVAAYATAVSPELSEQVRLVEEQFSAGQTDLLRVYSARASLIQSRQAYLDSLQELARAAASLTAATGVGPDLFLLTSDGGEP